MDKKVKELLNGLVDALQTEEAVISMKTPSGELTLENSNGRYTAMLKKGRSKEKISFKETWEKAEELIDTLL